MTGLIQWLAGGAMQVTAALLLAVFGGLGLYVKGRRDGKAKIRSDADKAYRKSRERMDDAEAVHGDNPHIVRSWLSERGRAKRTGDL